VNKRLKAQGLKSKITTNCLLFLFYSLLPITYCLLSSCATNESLDLVRQDINQLRRESLTIKNELNNLKEKASGAASEDSFNVVRQSQAEIQSQLSNISRDIQILSGRFDENKYFTEKALKDSATEMELIRAQIKSIEDQVKDTKEKLLAIENQVRQMKEPPEKQSEETEKKLEEPEKESQQQEKQSAKPAAPTDKTAKYKAAYNAFKAKKYKEARQMFEAFLKEYPNDGLSDNAQFWIAETYYREKDYEGAILAYELLLKKYPNSPKIPSGLLKQGLSFIEIGDNKTGKIILEQLIGRYPDSNEAKTAKKTIEDIKKKPAKR
jgi:tol-pal system protein YbgF